MDEFENYTKDLVKLEFYRNDAAVYVALLETKASNPSNLAKTTKIQRPRIYDSLKRLVDKGYIIKDDTQKRPGYLAMSPEIVVKDIQEKLIEKLEISKELLERFQKEPQKKQDDFTIAFKYNEKAVRTITLEIIERADKTMTIFFPHYQNHILSEVTEVLIKSPKATSLNIYFILSPPKFANTFKVQHF